MNTKMLNASADTRMPAMPASASSQAEKNSGCRCGSICRSRLGRPAVSASVEAPVRISSSSALNASTSSAMP